MVRKYHIIDGKEITLWIHIENEIFTSLQSYSQHKISDEYLVAYENTKLISISKQNSGKLARFNQFVTFSNALMEKEVVNIDIHSKAFNSKMPKDDMNTCKVLLLKLSKELSLDILHP